MSKKNRTTFSL